MEYVNLGRTGCKVSRLCLGTMNFGGRAPEPESHAIMSHALEAGIQFWDSADVYGESPNEGLTETVIGNWFAANPDKRDQIVFATKYHGAMGRGVNDRGGSAFHMIRACEASLRRLKTDRIDLYQMHHVNRDCTWDETYEALDTLRRQGKIIYAGTSNFAGWQLAEAVESAKRLGVLGIVSEQSRYSLACRHIEMEVLPACRHYGIAMIPWSPLGGGFLGGILSGEKGVRRALPMQQSKIERYRPQLERWEEFCRQIEQKPADVALAWMLQIPGVTAPIIGPRTMRQLDENLHAMAIKLTEDQLKMINDIWPPISQADVRAAHPWPPRLEAPEAYAW